MIYRTISGSELIDNICKKLDSENIMVFDSNIINCLRKMNSFEMMNLIEDIGTVIDRSKDD